MTAELIIAFGSIVTAVVGFIIAIYTMRTSANKEFVERLQKRLDDEIQLRKEEREEFKRQLKDIADERDRLRDMLEKERIQWRVERDNLIEEIEKLKRQINTKRRPRKDTGHDTTSY